MTREAKELREIEINLVGNSVWVVPPDVNKVDVFLVGGGGAGGYQATYGGGGGGSGYTATFLDIPVTARQEIPVTVGAGGQGTGVEGNGGYTQFLNENYRANGGWHGGNSNTPTTSSTGYYGGNGGSGGSAGRYSSATVSLQGGSDGGNGVSGSSSQYNGIGQGSTTRDWGDINGKRNAGGGSGYAYVSPYGTVGGESDYQEGSGADSPEGGTAARRGVGGGGYGGGGGGSTTTAGVGRGGQGVIRIRYESRIQIPIWFDYETPGTYTLDTSGYKYKYMSIISVGSGGGAGGHNRVDPGENSLLCGMGGSGGITLRENIPLNKDILSIYVGSAGVNGVNSTTVYESGQGGSASGVVDYAHAGGGGGGGFSSTGFSTSRVSAGSGGGGYGAGTGGGEYNRGNKPGSIGNTDTGEGGSLSSLLYPNGIHGKGGGSLAIGNISGGRGGQYSNSSSYLGGAEGVYGGGGCGCTSPDSASRGGGGGGYLGGGSGGGGTASQYIEVSGGTGIGLSSGINTGSGGSFIKNNTPPQPGFSSAWDFTDYKFIGTPENILLPNGQYKPTISLKKLIEGRLFNRSYNGGINNQVNASDGAVYIVLHNDELQVYDTTVSTYIITNSVPNADVYFDEVLVGRTSSSGAFRIEIQGTQSYTCRLDASRGPTSSTRLYADASPENDSIHWTATAVGEYKDIQFSNWRHITTTTTYTLPGPFTIHPNTPASVNYRQSTSSSEEPADQSTVTAQMTTGTNSARIDQWHPGFSIIRIESRIVSIPNNVTWSVIQIKFTDVNYYDYSYTLRIRSD